MDWLAAVHSNPIAEAVFILGLVAGTGLFLGSIRIFGVGLEIAGVLFAGLAFGYFGAHLHPEVIDFLRDFGLVLFVYSIGIQVGPGFGASLKRDGIKLNLMAATIVLLGVATTLLIHRYAGLDLPTAVGLLAGATTNTPSLAAAQQALKDMPAATEAIAKLPAVGYAVAYPFGIMGIILTMLLIRIFFRIKVEREAVDHAKSHESKRVPISAVNFVVKNPNLDGRSIEEIPALSASVVISRIKHGDDVEIAHPKTVIHAGDVLLAVGAEKALEEMRMIVGDVSDIDLRTFRAGISSQRIVVTTKAVLGKSIQELDFLSHYGVTITRLIRRDVELTVYPGLILEYGDVLTGVGTKDGLKQAAKSVGNSAQTLNHPQLIPVFLGIALGAVVGSIPFYMPGMPAPIKLGLAGGPLLVSIFLSRIRRIGSVVMHVPAAANFMMREIGIVLFLACVGLKSGDVFVKAILEGQGLHWMLLGAIITFAPLMIVGLVARLVFKTNFMTLCGLLAGSMTDPPALAFANTMAVSSAPSLSYATVYPLVMMMRIISAQVLILFFFR